MACVLGQSHCSSHGKIPCTSSLYNKATKERTWQESVFSQRAVCEQLDLEVDEGTR